MAGGLSSTAGGWDTRLHPHTSTHTQLWGPWGQGGGGTALIPQQAGPRGAQCGSEPLGVAPAVPTQHQHAPSAPLTPTRGQDFIPRDFPALLADGEWDNLFEKSPCGYPHTWALTQVPVPACNKQSQHRSGAGAAGGVVRAWGTPLRVPYPRHYLAVGCNFTSPNAQCLLEKGCSIIKNRSMKDYLHFKNS